MMKKVKLDQPLYLLIVKDGQKIYERKIYESPVLIGRSLDCDIPLPQFTNLSLQHVQLVAVDDHWVAVDLNSDRGLAIGDQRQSQVTIESGMTLKIDEISLYFEFEGEDSKRPSYTQDQHSPYPEAPSQGGLELVTSYQPQVQAHTPQRRSVKPAKATRILNDKWFHRDTNKWRFIDGQSGAESIHLFKSLPQHTVPGQRRAVEVHLIWRGQVYDSRIYFSGDNIFFGTGAQDLYAPVFKGSYQLGLHRGQHLELYLQKSAQGEIERRGHKQSISSLFAGSFLPHRGKGYVLTVQAGEQCRIQLSADFELFLRFTTAPRQLSKNVVRTPDQLLKKAMSISGSIHLAFLLLAVLLAPTVQAPKIKGLPPRVAKILVPKVKPPEPKVALPPQVEPPEAPTPVAELKPPQVRPLKKRVEKRRLPTPKRVIVRSNERIKAINKLAPRPTQTPPVDRPIGALAALSSLGKPSTTSTTQPVAININPNAGGQKSPSSQNMIGQLKATGGRLPAGGMTGVKTVGQGYGTGSGYGVQGLKGTAGQRGVAGSVIGDPKLMDLERTEGLTRQQVMDVVKRHLGQIQQCYERALLSSPQLHGRAEYEWHILPKGTVDWSKTKRSDMSGADQLNDCVLALFKKMKFPIAKNGESTTPTIGFPFGRL